MKVGIYARISQSEDKQFNVSIENQIEGISSFCKKNNYPITKIYKDISYSGSDFNRPGFKKMIEDAEEKIIDTIIVKDLSRFGRNHLEVGRYLDREFLINDTRFIAIDDNYDNQSKVDEFIAFRNIFNEMYLKDLKKKQLSTIEYKSTHTSLNNQKGRCYGYREGENKQIIIDEEAAKAVKMIFELALTKNIGDKKIASIMSDAQMINPSHRRYQLYHQRVNLTKNPYYWSASSINRILNNKDYTGVIVNKKTKTIDGKVFTNKERIYLDSKIPPIIEKELFNKVQNLRNFHSKYGVSSASNPFKSFIYCNNCKHAMIYQNIYYICRKCKIIIKKSIVIESLINEINMLIKAMKKPKDKELTDFLNKRGIFKKNDLSISKQKMELRKIENQEELLFESYAIGKITEEKLKETMDYLTLKKESLSNNQEYDKMKEMKSKLSMVKLNLEDIDLIRALILRVFIQPEEQGSTINIEFNFENPT